MKKIISTAGAPAAIGPYSQATEYQWVIYVSGQLPLDPKTGVLSQDDIQSQTRLVLNNVSHILQAGGSSLAHILKVSILLKDINDFAAVNEAYAAFFPENPPARVCYQAAALPKDARIEMEVIAIKEES